MVWCRNVENILLGYCKAGLLDGWCESNQRTDTHCRKERLNSSKLRWERRAGSSRGWREWWRVSGSCLDNIQCPEDCQAQGGCQ